MRKALSGIAAALAMVATGFAAAAPADAQRFRGGYHGGYGYRGGYGYHRGGGAGLAVGAGILGLAAGAAIASRPYYGGGYGGGYGGYGYYAPPPPPPVYYAPAPAYGYGYAPARCWDGYRGFYRPC